MANRSTCVVVGDADESARDATSELLRRIGFDVLEADTGTEALEIARTARPAAVVLDVALPEISGYQVCHMLRAELGDELRIVLLSDHVEQHDRVAGLLLGADDYVAKPFVPDDLLARIKQLRVKRSAPDATAAGLTPSELRVLRMLAQGMHPKTIANQLSIAPKTASMHIQNSMRKLGVHSRAQAVAQAHQLGLVDNNGNGSGASSV
jgi:DNA-binding NarL/FixJ family response regulator